MATCIQLCKVLINREQDILLARQRARQISQFVGFSNADATRITTALSEITRNAFEYGGSATVGFAIEGQLLDRQDLVITVVDQGVGIGDVPAVLAPDFKSRTGMGLGLKGSRALMDRFTITSAVGKGTTVMMAKSLPWASSKFGALEAAALAGALAAAVTATPMGELQTQNQALLNALHELTQQRAELERLETIAREARDAAESARQIATRSLVVRERFMALTTHEFRTPLNAIVGYLDLLDMELEPLLTAKQREYFTRLKKAAKHLGTMTNDFLDMAQDDAGRLRVESVQNPAREVMREAVALVAPQAAARNVAVRLAVATENLAYMGDVHRVRQVLVNLLGNAVSFTPPSGDVRVTAARVEVSHMDTLLRDGPWCTFTVADMGPGIPDDKLAYVFEPFVQLSSDGQATRQGSGLGLTVSRQLALLMGGDLTVTSTAAGAVFTLWLPEASCRAQL